jgi:hypothetical protein
MKTTDERSTYCHPTIDLIKMDHEISLTLETFEAPDDPEATMMPPELTKNIL